MSQQPDDSRLPHDPCGEPAQAFRAAFEEAPFGMALLDSDFRIVRANRQLCALLEFAEAELIGRSILDVTDAADVDQDRGALLALVAGQVEERMVEKRYRTRTGGCIWVRVRRARIGAADRSTRCLLTIVEDISLRRSAEQALNEQRERLRAIFNSGYDAILVHTPDGRLIDANATALRMYGMREESVASHTIADLSAGSMSMAEAQRRWQQVLAGGAPLFEWRARRVDDGSEFDVEVSLCRLEHGGKTTVLAHVRDVSECRRVERELRESREDLRRAQAVAHTGSWRMDVRDNTLHWSDEVYRIFGIPLGTALCYESFLAAVHPDDRERVDAAWRAALHGAPYDIEHRIVIGREVKWVHERAELELTAEGGIAGGFGTVQEITERKRMEEEIRHMAQHDPLTGLPNRRLFDEILQVALPHARRTRTRLALMYLDLDRFKEINDGFGHEAGDALLAAAAGRLRGAVRSTDTVSRVGGDEFNILLTGIRHGERAAEAARDIIDAFREPFRVAENAEVSVTTSVGISVYPDDAEDPELLLRFADRAMYFAKEQGRNRFQFFNAEMNDHASRRAREESELRLALDRGELELRYQPQRRMATGRITSVEALLRWRHPEHGLLPPAAFMPLAEESGLAIPIGRWVLATACSQLAIWRRAGASARVSVNVSRQQFRHPDLEASAARALAASGLDPACLELEVAEETVMEDVTRSEERLRRLHRQGIRIAVDNFGTGRSSLPWLRRLPIRSVKMDKAFVHGIGREADAGAIVHAVIDLSHRMRIKVVAEGVETDEQLSLLGRYGCDEVQGNLIGMPLPAPEMTQLLL